MLYRRILDFCLTHA